MTLLAFSHLAAGALSDARRGANRTHQFDGLFRQSIYGRLAGYEDVNDADWLRNNEVRLQLHALAYNLATFLRRIELPEAMADWSLTSLQLKLIKTGARVARHARTITFQLAEVAVIEPMSVAILHSIRRLRAPP